MELNIFLTLSLSLCMWTRMFVSGQRTRQTFGSSGEVCEDGFRRCLRARSSCVNETCQCNGPTWRGSFVCYPEGWYHAEIYNDPSVRTFARESTHFHLPCRYLFSHFRTVYTGWSNSSCEVLIHAYNRKVRGKVVVYGFDLALKVLRPISGPSDAAVSFREYGTAHQGIYTFYETGSMTFSPDGPWDYSDPPATLYLGDSMVRTRYDPYNNFVFVQVDSCGFSVRLRPFDEFYRRDQPLLPGLALTVNPANEPEWLSLDKVIALVQDGEPNLESIARESGLDPEQALLLRFAHSRVTQNPPIPAAPECTRLSLVVNSCQNMEIRKRAFDTCVFILSIPRMDKCLGLSFDGNRILSVFNRCFQSVCLGDTRRCSDIQERISACRNITEHPEIKNFLLPATCQF